MARATGGAERIIELGAGTGCITRALLEHLPRHGRLLAFETDAALRQRLQVRLQDPRLRLTGASAEELHSTLAGEQVPCVVSGLPFQVMAEASRQCILAAIRDSLQANGRLVAFQYGRRGLPLFQAHFRKVRVLGPVWLNLPPALVFICQP